MSKIIGVANVLKNLNKKMGKIEKSVLPSLIKAVIMIRRDMDLVSPKIPVGKTGNLRSSWFTIPSDSGKPKVIFGFSANYAWWVHEMVGAKYQRPGAGAKFLEAALNRNKKKIIEMIRNGGKV